MRFFLAHPGKLIEREELMRYIWNAEHTGDVRTNNVHISWLRKEFEKEPRSSRWLKTIRAVSSIA